MAQDKNVWHTWLQLVNILTGTDSPATTESAAAAPAVPFWKRWTAAANSTNNPFLHMPRLLKAVQDLLKLPVVHQALFDLHRLGMAEAMATFVRAVLGLWRAPAVQQVMFAIQGADKFHATAELFSKLSTQKLFERKDFWDAIFDPNTIQSIANGRLLSLLVSSPVVASVGQSLRDTAKTSAAKVKQRFEQLGQRIRTVTGRPGPALVPPAVAARETESTPPASAASTTAGSATDASRMQALQMLVQFLFKLMSLFGTSAPTGASLAPRAAL